MLLKSNMSADLKLLEPLLSQVNAGGMDKSGSSGMIKPSVAEEEKDDEYWVNFYNN